MNKSDKLKFAVYSRKSVYSAKGDSIDNQILECKKRILMQFPDTCGDDIIVFSDEGYSAKNTERPEFQKMLAAIKSGKISGVVCYRLDRLSRNVGDFANLIEELNSLNVIFISVNENFDTSSPMGRAMMNIASVFAQLERETIAERVRDNMHALARKGQWLGGTPPLGFESEKLEKVTVDDKVKTACRLKPNPEETGIVRIIFEKFLELKSLSGVSKHLISRGIKSRKGNMFSLIGIKEILQNPVYCAADEHALLYFTEQESDVCFEEKDCTGEFGLLAYNKRDHHKKNIPRNTVDKWIIAVGKHKGIISGEDWVSVQKILESNKTDNRRTSQSSNNAPVVVHNDYALLSGMIKCEKCGARIFAKNRYKKNNPNLFDYVCSNKIRGSKKLCGSENIGGQEADILICEYLTQELNQSSEIYKYLDKLKKEVSEKKRENPLEAIEKEINKRITEKKNLLDALKMGVNAELVKNINAETVRIDDELKPLEAERRKIEKGINTFEFQELQIELITEALTDLRNNFRDLTLHEKRTIIKLLVKEIVWDGESFHIFMYGE
ncbi:MAG: recombinase family protein [Oscillospiraceae bacterium]|nr:recombinase family protein [Oscillospiraceae bacterium]